MECKRNAILKFNCFNLVRNNESQIIKDITPINFPELNQLYLGHNLIVSV